MWFLDDQPLIALRQQLPHTTWKWNSQPPSGLEKSLEMVEEEPPKPMEEAENIELMEGDVSKTTKVEKELQRSLRDKLV